MSNTQNPAEIAEAFALAGLTPETSRWGHLQARGSDSDRIVRVTEDDGTYYLIVFSDDRAKLILAEVKVSGAMAHPATLAALIELGLDTPTN